MQSIKKLALGTVQFGLDYGISNTNGVPDDHELQAILNLAAKSGITILDTAAAYGNAEERLGAMNGDAFDIVTKFPKTASPKVLETQLDQTLQKLKAPKVYGYIAHNADVLLENPSLWNVLQKAKNENKIQKTGYSLYHPEQLHQVLQLGCVPDLVQLPYSILDRKFEAELVILKELGTEIHVRSVFLQGLYFMDLDHFPEKLQPIKTAVRSLKAFCEEAQVAVGAAALNFAVSNPNIDKVVIGVENTKQLQDNIDTVLNWKPKPKLFSKLEAITVEDKSLLNPANW